MIDEILEITCWFQRPGPFLSDADHVVGFQRLSQDLTEVAPGLKGLAFKTDQDASPVPIDDPALPNTVTDFFEQFQKDHPDDELSKFVSGSKPFLGPDGKVIWPYRIMYMWDGLPNHDWLRIEWPLNFSETRITAELVADLVGILTSWRTASLVSAAPYALKIAGKRFPEYHSSGFGIWLPSLPTGMDIDETHFDRFINDGRLIMTAPAMFNLADATAVERLLKIDTQLIEAAALPSLEQYPPQL
ncbi:hypothetical protein [uncultured Litoreibacter sp.]|uniref:hypothetical protein n=1 Tax=uncultured Litoreibacter sp. TaxID=1392394 RepID=UPI0026054F4E|nr:hypothetical protein [uncultured Litoreibacter sp.]